MEAVHVVKPIIHDVSLDAVFLAQAAAFFAQKPTALCFLYQPETSIIYSKIGRLNKVQIQNLDKVDQIRSLVQDLSKTIISVGHRDIRTQSTILLVHHYASTHKTSDVVHNCEWAKNFILISCNNCRLIKFTFFKKKMCVGRPHTLQTKKNFFVFLFFLFLFQKINFKSHLQKKTIKQINYGKSP